MRTKMAAWYFVLIVLFAGCEGAKKTEKPSNSDGEKKAPASKPSEGSGAK